MKAGNVLGEDVSEYETLYKNIVAAFQETWPVYHTQTECILAAHFHLAKDCQAAADQLAKLVTDAGVQLKPALSERLTCSMYFRTTAMSPSPGHFCCGKTILPGFIRSQKAQRLSGSTGTVLWKTAISGPAT